MHIIHQFKIIFNSYVFFKPNFTQFLLFLN